MTVTHETLETARRLEEVLHEQGHTMADVAAALRGDIEDDLSEEPQTDNTERNEP